jgi:cytochrome b involved in lipid metabolism
MKKILILVLVLVLAGAGVFFYLESNEENDLQNFANNFQSDANPDKTISMSEVAMHNSASDCWLVIDRDVLDVTSFVDKHPGGSVITEGCGKDATGYFEGVREHVKPIVKMLYGKMVIGKLGE